VAALRKVYRGKSLNVATAWTRYTLLLLLWIQR